MSSHQKNSGYSARCQDAFELRRLNALFLATMKFLKCRPEPRWRFDDVARDDRRRNHPGAEAIADSRTILTAAVGTGDRDTINATRLEIANYWDACKASALREVIPDGASIDDAVIGFHRASAEALTAVATVGMTHSEAAALCALRELREADGEGERLEALLEASVTGAGQRTVALAR